MQALQVTKPTGPHDPALQNTKEWDYIADGVYAALHLTQNERVKIEGNLKSFQRQVIIKKRYTDGTVVTCMRWETYKDLPA